MVLEGTGREFIESCQRGERNSFRTLFEARKDKVYSIALRYSGDQAEAMDIAEEIFSSCFRVSGISAERPVSNRGFTAWW